LCYQNTVGNCASVGFIQNEFIMVHGHMDIKRKDQRFVHLIAFISGNKTEKLATSLAGYSQVTLFKPCETPENIA
jgi:hypothetical protein